MNSSHQKKKKYIASLPPDFQEVIMSAEMELQQGLNVQILRKLVYLYTRGMQYYDLIHKDKFKQFYSDKLVSLLTTKNVEKFLDKNPINFEDKDDLDLLFQKKEEKKENKNTIINEISNEMKDFSTKVRKNSINLVKKKLIQVNNNLNKIDKALSNEMIEQMAEFEANKRKKKIKKSQNKIIDNNNENIIKETQEDKNSDTNSISTPSSNDEELIQNSKNIIKSPEDELKILELSGINLNSNPKLPEENNSNNTPTKNLIGNNPMLREIEDYVQKNMNEMYQAFEELKASFQEEINEAIENGFDDIADGLKEDLQVELDNLKDQYEEQRRIETEKIKDKYSKRNTVIID